MFDVIYYKNDTLIKVVNVRNSLSNSAINNATVQIVGIKDYGSDTEINPELMPITLNHETGTEGVYSGTIPNNMDLVPNKKYTCMLQITTVDQIKGYWEFTFMCRLRKD